MNNSSVKIRGIKIEDKDDWKTLFQMYADFYKVEINANILLHKKAIRELCSPYFMKEIKVLCLGQDLAFSEFSGFGEHFFSNLNGLPFIANSYFILSCGF